MYKLITNGRVNVIIFHYLQLITKHQLYFVSPEVQNIDSVESRVSVENCGRKTFNKAKIRGKTKL